MRKLIVALFSLLVLGGNAFADSTPHWFQVRSPHFVVLTDSSDKQGRKLAAQFEQMRSLFNTVLPNPASDGGQPITVLALRDKKGFQSLLPSSYLAKGQLELAGMFLRTQDRNYILLRLDAQGEHPYSVVYHEYTHFRMRKAQWMPLWLNEGLAEFYQNTDIRDKDVVLGQPSGEDIVYLRQNQLIPLRTLLTVDHNSPYYHEEQKGSVFYAESWALAHYIEVDDFQHKTHRLQDYAHFLSAGEDSLSAAQHAFGDLGRLQIQLQQYTTQMMYQAFKLSMAFTVDEASLQSGPVSLADVNAARADVLAHNGRSPEARELLEAVLREDPKDALAHEAMGAIAFQSGDRSAAKKWYAEATELDSQSYFAYFYSALIPLMDGDTQNASIEPNLRKCIKLEPTYAPAYDALAQYLASQHKDLDEAHVLTIQAVQLEPQELNYRLNVAQVLVAQKKYDDAIRVLHYASEHVAKTPDQVAEVEMRLQNVKQYKAALSSGNATAGSSDSSTATAGAPGAPARRIVVNDQERVLPAASTSAPRHTLKGVLRNVKCSYPSVLTMDLDQAGKLVPLFAPNYFKINFTTANYVESGDLDPCKAIDGMKARVEYAEVADKDLSGQVLSIELSR